MVFPPDKTPCRGPSETRAETPLCPEKSEY